MATMMKRLTVSLPDDIERGVNDVKKRDFLNDPQSKVIWYLLRLGIDAEKNSGANEETQASQAS